MNSVLAICASASPNSSCLRLLQMFKERTAASLNVEIWEELKTLPHFDAELTLESAPPSILEIRSKIENADGIVICSPEYVFSIPAGIKNLLEWCVSTRVFAAKPLGLITAAASGQKAHQDLQLVLRTIEVDLPEDRCLLINGIKGKLGQNGIFSDPLTEKQFIDFCDHMTNLSRASESQ
jgi:NAD(P)H-dependent FMN reductase